MAVVVQVLSTGRYTLSDVRCRTCCTKLGWKYLAAESAAEKYKENAVLLQQGALQRINNLAVRPVASRPGAAPHAGAAPQLST